VILAGRHVIGKFVRKHVDARQWLAEWTRNVEGARWAGLHDVRKLYPSADGGVKLSNGRLVTVFNVRGNDYRLIADIVYAAGIVNVLDILTHAEYSKDLWKDWNYP
jgi:mRNA interferase HigB